MRYINKFTQSRLKIVIVLKKIGNKSKFKV